MNIMRVRQADGSIVSIPLGNVGGNYATAEQGAKADTAVQPEDLGTMATEAAADYIKKSEAPGYDNILTKTEATATYGGLVTTVGVIQGSDTGKSMRSVAKEEVNAAAGNYATAAQGAKADLSTQVQIITWEDND